VSEGPQARGTGTQQALRAVVGIGASAGGLEALSRFFDAMPVDSNLAFVVVLHLDPTHQSQMAALLSRRTTMPVVEIQHGMRLAPNGVFVIAPDQYVTIEGAQLRVFDPEEPRGRRRPVDVFFTSLAHVQHERAICIVMSGTGSNGTQALREVKSNGGLTIAQSPETAGFDGMPRSAINAGVIDHVLAPEAMPDAILSYVRHSYVQTPEAAPIEGEQPISTILSLLRVQVGRELHGYKKSTLQRRIHRRMGLRNVTSISDYVELLRQRPAESKALVRDLMINVTGFFRDQAAWRLLADTVIAPLVAERPQGASIRMWVPACSSGEEAYSAAMLTVERAEATGKPFDFKIFATDSEEENLAAARAGVYPEAALASVSPELLTRFFDRLNGAYRVKRALRELVLFAAQNVLGDPPFARLDLISCRNLLIYLEPEVQRKVISVFHFALKEGGYLFLGGAETVGRLDELFETVNKKARIYRRLGPTRYDLIEFPPLGAPLREAPPFSQPVDAEPRAADLARRVLLERYAPAAVLIDHKCRALYFHGATAGYLQQPSGEPTRDILAMASNRLRVKLRGAIHEVLATHHAAAFTMGGHRTGPICVTVSPVPGARASGPLLLVSFESQPQPSPAAADVSPPEGAEERSGELALEEELKTTRSELQATIEQLESANEELKAANEEHLGQREVTVDQRRAGDLQGGAAVL
jgi:two-component system, chemotaxis family, CheB/CheR fusion protein